MIIDAYFLCCCVGTPSRQNLDYQSDFPSKTTKPLKCKYETKT